MENHPKAQPLIGAALCRVSLEKQVGNYSLETQDLIMDELGAKFGVIFPPEFRLEDAGFSGSDFSRPSIQKVLQWAREGRIQAVGWPHIDRFARGTEGALKVIRELDELKIKILLGDTGWYRDEAQFRFSMQVMLALTEYQRREIQSKSIAAVKTKIEKNKRAHGGKSPFGWAFLSGMQIAAEALKAGLPIPQGKPENSHKRIEPNIQTVRLMGQLALAGYGQRGICRELFARGIKSPNGNLRWSPPTVAKILRDPLYHTGLWHYGKRTSVAPKPERIRKHNDRHRVKSSWKIRPASEWYEPLHLDGGPIWTEAQQEAIIEALERNGRTGDGRPAAQDGAGYEAILKSMVTCRICGAAVVPKHKRTAAGPRCWYVCANRDRVTNQHKCEAGHHSIRATILEEATKEAVERALAEDLDALIEEHRREIIGTIDPTELDQMKVQEKRLMGKMAEAINKGLDSDLPEEKAQYAERVTEFKIQLVLLRRRITSFTAESDIPDVDTVTIATTIRAAMRTEDRGEMREILSGWIHKMKWAYNEAEITLRVPTKGFSTVVNCKWEQPHVCSLRPSHDAYIYLKPIKIRVAA